MNGFPYTEIEKKIGYTFKDKTLLKEAFTHSTYAHAHGGKDNERMEYLGDAVLELVVTEWQYARDTQASEGVLTRERQKLVCQSALDSAVDALDVRKYLLVSGSKANIGQKTTSSLFETIVGAIYLDGGYQYAKEFILKHGRLEAESIPVNHKGELQEFLQKRGEEPPRYETEKSGKDNAPVFKATAAAMGKRAQGVGRSKKEAEQEAANALLDMLLTKRKN